MDVRLNFSLSAPNRATTPRRWLPVARGGRRQMPLKRWPRERESPRCEDHQRQQAVQDILAFTGKHHFRLGESLHIRFSYIFGDFARRPVNFHEMAQVKTKVVGTP